MTRSTFLQWPVFAVLLLTACFPYEVPEAVAWADSTQPSPMAEISSDRIDEASGLARSHINPEWLWIHNDSGSAPELHAITAQGGYRGRVRVAGVRAVDWEDMASFVLDATPYLVIGDIGDNRAKRATVEIIVIQEPRLPESPDGLPVDMTVPVAWRFTVKYEDGPRDCEGLAVDVQAGLIYLLSKRDQPPRLYAVPLRPGRPKAVARFLGELRTIPKPTADDLVVLYGQYRSQPTALDLSPAGNVMAVFTYKDAYLYKKRAGDFWIEALSRPPVIIDIPQLPQAEAGVMSYDGRSLFVASEQLPAHLVRIDLPVD